MISFLNEYGARWAAYFLPALVQNTIFLAVVLIVLHKLRGFSAGVRYLVGVVGLVKLLLPPLFPSTFGMGTAGVIERTGGVSGAIRFLPVAAPGESAAVIDAGVRLGPAGFLLALWAAVAAIYLFTAAVRTLRLAWRLRDSVQIKEIEGFEAPGRVGLYMSDGIVVPMTLILYPRRIFVPSAWADWSNECRRMVVRHEAAHLRRRDGLVQALQILAQALYFFHPLVLILGRRLDEYREMACDDISAGRTGRAGVEYSRFLVEIAESIVERPAICESAATLLRKKNELLNRVMYQMKGGAMVSKGRMILILAALLLLVLPLSWYHTSAASRERSRARTVDTVQDERNSGDREVPPQPAPPATGSPPAAPTPPREPVSSVSVEVGAGEHVTIDGGTVGWKDAAEEMRKIAELDNRSVIKLKCDAETPMEQIHRIHEVLRLAGLDRIEYRNGTGYGKPLVLPPPDMEERLAGIDAAQKAQLIINTTGKVTLDGETVEMEDLGGVVAKRIEQAPHLVVLLRTEKKTLYKDFLGALAQLEKAGAMRIAIQEPEGN